MGWDGLMHAYTGMDGMDIWIMMHGVFDTHFSPACWKLLETFYAAAVQLKWRAMHSDRPNSRIYRAEYGGTGNGDMNIGKIIQPMTSSLRCVSLRLTQAN